MISAVAPRTYIPTASTKCGDTAPSNPAPPAQPAPPSETVDLSNIDCPIKAAQLPILEPSFQLGLAGAIAFAIMSGMSGGGGVPLVTIDTNNQFGNGNDITNSYTFDLKDQANPLSVNGFANSAPISGGVVIDQASQSLQYAGTVGNSPENLTFSLDESNPSAPGLNIKGQFGSIDANVTLSLLGNIESMQSPEDFQGWQVNGTIGGQAYHVENRLSINQNAEPGQDGSIALGSFSSRGSLGENEISKDYTVTAQMTGSGITATATGSGVNAGVQSNVSTTVSLIP